ncbi:MAG: sugar ABC transporter ATP-binding protein [Acidimicrobiales bacterium]
MNIGVESAAAPERPPRTNTNTPVLEVRGLQKIFGGNVALVDANLTVRPGEIHALLGENGAGKSTMIRCVARIFPPDGGEILANGEPLPERLSSANGLAFIHQETSLVEDMTIAENIAMSIGYARRFGVIDWASVERAASEALALMGVELNVQRLVAELPQATRTVVAIARAVAEHASLLVLDEPTATLSALEVDALFGIVRTLRDTGVGIIFVTHRLDEVYQLCDRVTIMRDGRTIASDDVGNISKARLVELITGHSGEFGDHVTPSAGVETLVGGEDVKTFFLGPISFSVRHGEVVGFTGLTNAGHYQLGALLFGLYPLHSGSLSLYGEPYRPMSVRDAMSRGIGYVPPDRSVAGLARDMSLAENLFLNPTPADDIYRAGRLLSRSREQTAATTLLERFRVRPSQPQLAVSTLSGGNAQKVLVGRWLHGSPRLLILNDLSFGVDIGAREQMYEIVERATHDGTTVIVITSDFEEIETMCSRAYILARGLLVAELSGAELNVPAITAKAVTAGGSGR